MNLIDLHESTTDTSRADRLKQQLHELYIHNYNHKVNSMEEDCPVSFMTNDKSMTSTMQTSANTRTSALTAYDEKACIQTTSHNGSMEMNRNQNACNDSCMDTSYQPKAEEKHMMKLSYETVGENNTQDNIAPIRQSNITDNCTQEWMTHLQHKCGKYRQ